MNKFIPKLRFKKFINGSKWVTKRFSDIMYKSFSGGTPKVSNKRFYIGTIPFIRSSEINNADTELHINKLALNKSSAKMIHKGDILYALYGATSGEVGIAKINGAINQAILDIILNNNNSNIFIFELVSYLRSRILHKYLQGGQGNLSGRIVKSIKLNLPSLPEQQLIGKFFAKLDKLIQLQQKKVALLKKLKRGYLQKLFPRKGESVPRLRFKGFHGKWKLSTFKSILNYEQPTKYRVKNTHYSSSGIPVLTANKAFILGYTHEKHIYNKGNCIIFDDFTLDNKFVNFPFMIKSSAIKILTSKNSNLYFDYELLNVVHLIHEGHKRHYISMVQNFKILIPSLYEQDKIGNFFDDMDSHINSQRNKLTHLRKLKKAYLQKMFC